jgi:hypothetical protein
MSFYSDSNNNMHTYVFIFFIINISYYTVLHMLLLFSCPFQVGKILPGSHFICRFGLISNLEFFYPVMFARLSR